MFKNRRKYWAGQNTALGLSVNSYGEPYELFVVVV